ncbi:MAG: hypothetical protein ACYS76_01675 [Planctomycetota bacterium]|jgi:hypothetical protein
MTEQKISFPAKLDELEVRYSHIEKQIAEPAIASDSAEAAAIRTELRNQPFRLNIMWPQSNISLAIDL